MFAELNVLMTRVAEHAHSFYRCVGNFMNLEETLYLHCVMRMLRKAH